MTEKKKVPVLTDGNSYFLSMYYIERKNGKKGPRRIGMIQDTETGLPRKYTKEEALGVYSTLTETFGEESIIVSREMKISFL